MVKPPAGGGLKQHIRSSHYFDRLAFFSSIFALILSFLILNPPVINNDEASATTGTATASTTSITLTSLDNSATVDIASLTPSGSFTTSTSEQSATFSLTTNNYTGYTLAIIANDDNGNLSTTVEPGDTPETISSISTITSTEDFSASTSTAAENYNNKWGFRPNKYVDATNNTVVDNTGNNPVYLPSPTTTPTLLDKTSTANTTTANTYTLALGLRANQDTKAGTYTKTFNLVVTANPISYTINYNQNTVDTVTNMPTTQASDTSSTSITLTNTVPQRSHYSFIGWCNTTTTTTNGVDSCSGTTYNPNGAGTNLTYGIDQTTANTTTLYAMWKIDTFTQTTEVRYENADGTWGSYNTVDTQTLNYGSSYSWSTAQINNFDSTIYQSASVSSYTVTEAHTNQVSIYRNTFTCFIQSRDQNADGSYTGYTTRVNSTLRYGQTCSWSSSADTTYQAASYSATITSNISQSLDRNRNSYTCFIQSRDQNANGSYTGYTTRVNSTLRYGQTCSWSSSADTTYQAASYSATITGNISQSLDINRQQYYLTVNKNASYISSVSGAGYYRVGQTASISATASSGNEFTSWSQTAGTTSSFGSTTSASTTFVMPASNATVYANGKQSCVSTISGTTMQSFSVGSTNYCVGATGTLTDSRDGTSYTVGKLADGKIWLLDNLALDLTNATVKNNLTVNTTNASNTTLNYLKNGGGTTSNQYATAGVATWTSSYSYSAPLINTASKNTSQSYGSGSGKIGVYYNYCAASAGSYCYGNGTSEGSPSGNATEDICPKGWRMPTGGSSGEYQALYTAYSSNATNFKNALRTPLSGGFDNGSASAQGSLGTFWSSTYYFSNFMYGLGVSSSSVYPRDGSYRGYGGSVRCVLQ